MAKLYCKKGENLFKSTAWVALNTIADQSPVMQELGRPAIAMYVQARVSIYIPS